MRSLMLKGAACVLALATGSMASAQHAGHAMPMPPAKKAAPKKEPAAKAAPKKAPDKKAPPKKPVAKKPVTTPAVKKPAPARKADPAPVVKNQPQLSHGDHPPAAPPAPVPAEPPPVDHGQMDHSPTAGAPVAAPAHDHQAMAAAEGQHGGRHAMTGALGPYPMAREAAGTAWQPDTSEHGGLHLMSGEWSFMAHGQLDLVHSWQGGRRGDSKTFPAGMLMGMARRPVGQGTLQFKAMLSPDPLMGKRGYPLLLASGETADGHEPLIDRQHPHDFFMELSASISHNLGPNSSAYLYAGLPGSPAFGPPAFMHRQSISTSPEAPITHHWLDSTHITFGVLTAGVVLDKVKIEASRFNGREPDQHRWNIETGPLDSTAVRLSWNPTPELSLQGSWAHLEEPEQLEPGVDQRRWSASGTWTRPTAGGWWSTSLAWGRKTVDSERFDAFAVESSLKLHAWTLFGRGEVTENNELLGHHEGGDGHTEAFRVGKISLGAVHDFKVGPNLKLGVGGLYAVNFVPDELEREYGSDPHGAMAFVRLKLE